MSVNQKYSWSAPSNIAMIKYWGKILEQEPMNPNLSWTLDECRTFTQLEILPGKFQIQYLFDGLPKDEFAQKIEKKFRAIYLKEIPELENHQIILKSSNTFPHSCGIASSASFYASLSLCLAELELALASKKFELNKDFLNRASYLARQGSGSACRSHFSPLVSWGATNNKYATPINEINSDFSELYDIVCLINSKEKKVSSTLGHSFMNSHPFRDSRIRQANENYSNIIKAISRGDWKDFITITESEALTLHGLMMSGEKGFILLEASTIELIRLLQAFREKFALKFCITLDAGPNLHIIVHQAHLEGVREFIEKNTELLEDNKYIVDKIGGSIKRESDVLQ